MKNFRVAFTNHETGKVLFDKKLTEEEALAEIEKMTGSSRKARKAIEDSEAGIVELFGCQFCLEISRY